MEPLISMIVAFACDFAPRGWISCQGQELQISQYGALFALLKTTYGGNGQTTFKLPDLRGRTLIGWGQGPGLSNQPPGKVGGVEDVTLLQTNIPPHTHTATATATSILYAEGGLGDSAGANGKLLAASLANIYKNPQPTTNQALSSESIKTTVDVQVGMASGASKPISVMQPYLAINYCIAVEGIFPSKN